MKTAFTLCMISFLILQTYYPINTTIYKNETNNINKICENCFILDDQITVDCFKFSNILNKSTCKIYYQICHPIKCNAF